MFQVPSKIDQKFAFCGKWGRNVKFCFRDPKRHILARNEIINHPCKFRWRWV